MRLCKPCTDGNIASAKAGMRGGKQLAKDTSAVAQRFHNKCKKGDCQCPCRNK